MSVAESPRSPQSLKRDHDSYESSMVDLTIEMRGTSASAQRDPSPARSSTDSLTDAGSTTPSLPSHSPPASAAQSSAFAAMNGNVQPPAKKPKLTFAEKEDRRILKEVKDRERAEEKAKKDAEKAKKDAEKAKKDTERRAAQEAERAAKEEKRAAQEAEKAAKEEKRKKREDEKRKAEEDKIKKERSQMRMDKFFSAPASTNQPKREKSVDATSPIAVALPATVTPSKPRISEYDKIFPEYPHEDKAKGGFTHAPVNRFERDEEGSRLLQDAIDNYIPNKGPEGQPFNALELFHISRLVCRGRQLTPTSELIAEIEYGNSKRPADLTSDSQSSNSQPKTTREIFRHTPLKFLHFKEDVRPPYYGTYTRRPKSGMKRLARNPLARDLPDTNYDYDSEAEWVEEDEEPGEDCDGEDEREDDGDEDDGMDGFLDDRDDVGVERLMIQGDLEPISTGLCWEDRKKRNTDVKMIKYRMENILDSTMKTIDPFSTTYWQPSAAMGPPRAPLTTTKANSVSVNGVSSTSSPIKSFFSNTIPTSTLQVVIPSMSPHPSTPPASTSRKGPKDNGKPKKLIPADDMPAFMEAILKFDNLTKTGLIEVLKKEFPGRGAPSIKATLEGVAQRVGAKEADKRWVLNESGK